LPNTQVFIRSLIVGAFFTLCMMVSMVLALYYVIGGLLAAGPGTG
jgi:hypothetical protein